ncbi:LptF/LptG family permease [Aureisphaera galaxeae]|uniref:LptF/LptG family permease n=1 Tax=Aureisphaera galaxeae TaxID=1538023 RepID=UPI00235002A3|nr:LptF/LptG family permease [Aureisphaera galaxeae]MDC8004791.1 LptF/LptG family permease [Aureisphaera galaxeae]
MKILDRYILVAFLKTFVSVFIILMFIFVLQTIWLYISELAGKDLDVWIILKFLWYFSPKLIPLVLPLTILVSSLMVFGNFSEKYEFAAMKSTGISLQRAMRSLTIFILGLSLLAFFFANNVIPYSEYKWQNLRRNIAQVSPSMAIVEGQFSSIGDDFNIKVDEKYGDNEQYFREVIIHQKNPKRPTKNSTVIIAKEGEVASEEGSNTLSLILKDGNYYEDVQLKNVMKQRNLPFAKSYFEEYTINIDLTKLNDADIDKDNKLSNHNMYSAGELVTEIDKLSDEFSKNIDQFGVDMYYRMGLPKKKDSTARKKQQDTAVTEVLDVFVLDRKTKILQTALDNIRGSQKTTQNRKDQWKQKVKRLNKHEIAFHEKFALAIACIILFFVGAPLGAIIRKGGMGLPMVVAVLLFLTYHFIGIFAKNSAEDGTMHPFIASWLSTFIMFPLGIWLTYRATTDQGIFDMDSFIQRFNFLRKKNRDDLENEEPIILTQHEKAMVLSKSEYQLKDMLKNPDTYDYSDDVRKAIIRELKLKGYSDEELGLL